jgi:hypothetical protein
LHIFTLFQTVNIFSSGQNHPYIHSTRALHFLPALKKHHEKTTALKRERPFLWGRLSLGGSANGAHTCASAAGNAGIGVDHELAIAFADSVDGALICTGTTCDTFFTDNVRHSKTPP